MDQDFLGKSEAELLSALRANFDTVNDSHKDLFIFTKNLEPRRIDVTVQADGDRRQISFSEKPNTRIEQLFPYESQQLNYNLVGSAIFLADQLILLKANQKFLDFQDAPFDTPAITIGKSLHQFCTGFTGSPSQVEWQKIIDTGNPLVDREFVFDGFKRGTTYWDIIIMPIFENGSIKFLVETARDVTQEVLNRKLILEKNQQLEAIIGNMSDGLSIFDKEGKYTFFNDPAKVLFCPTRNYIKKALDGYRAEYYDENGSIIPLSRLPANRVKRGERFDGMYMKVQFPDKTLYLNVSGAPVYDENGCFKMGVLCSQDITERIESEEKLKKQKDRLEAIINSMSDGLELIGGDMKVTFLNQSAKDFFYNSEAKLYVGDSLQYNKYFYGIDGEEIPKNDLPALRVLTQGSYQNYILTIDRPDKKIYASVNGSPVYDTSHNPIEAILCIRDITEDVMMGSAISAQTEITLKAEQEKNELLSNTLRQKEDFLSIISAVKNDLAAEVDALNILYALNSNFIVKTNLSKVYEEILKAATILTHTHKGSIQMFDAERQKLLMIKGYGLGAAFLERLCCIDLDVGTCSIAYLKKRRIIVGDVRESSYFQGKPSLQYLLEEDILCEQSTPLISSSGNLVGVLNTYYSAPKSFSDREIRLLDMISRMAADVIERTNTENALALSERNALKLVEELQRSDQNKTEFLNALSHELRNPLATIMTGLSLMDLTEVNPSNRETLEILKRQSKQLRRLIDDLLDITRITRNKIHLRKERFDLNKLARSIVRDNTILFSEHGIALDLDLGAGDGPLMISADPIRISQIIENLLNNSLKFTKSGGRTTLSVHAHDNSAYISVQDTGTGIDAKFLPNLFEPFKQADNTLARQDGGLGLGLSIVKGIAELHGGTVTAHSDGLNKGSQFTILLPIKYQLDQQIS